MPILFSDLCLLFDKIASLSRRAASKGKPREAGPSPIDVFTAWIGALHSPSHADGLILFRLIFPEHDIRRRYGLKETLLARELPQALGFAPPPALLAWNDPSSISDEALPPHATHGCFGLSLQEALKHRKSSLCSPSLSIHRVDALLDELASHCDFSAQDVKRLRSRSSSRPRQAILSDLFSFLSAEEAGYLAQIVLRDLSPLLYPIPSLQSEGALLEHNTTSIKILELGPALASWHWALPTIFRFRADLDAAFRTLEANCLSQKQSYSPSELRAITARLAAPLIGHRVEIPSAAKGRSCSKVARTIAETGVAYAEVKYDGERMQIHVNLQNTPCITIFSKSRRDSTIDRHLTHPIILAALGLPLHLCETKPSLHLLERISGCIQQGNRSQYTCASNVILEAEMVAYNEDSGEVDEFSNIPLCLNPDNEIIEPNLLDSSRSYSNASKEIRPMRHLALVFFDILSIDNRSMVFEPYSARRSLLESLIKPIEGYTMLAHRTCLDFRGLNEDDSLQQLVRTFARCIVNRNEGLMIKTADSMYNDDRPMHRWTKLKRDYIPGLGDTMTCSIVGASWSKERGRELRVPSDCFTTFHVGALENEVDICNGVAVRPRYRVLFSVSHLPDRSVLAKANQLIKVVGGTTRAAWTGRIANTWEFSISGDTQAAAEMTYILARPIVFELYGAGFARPRGSPYYELRFPRVSAIHEVRSVSEAATLSEIQKAAKEACSWVGNEAESEVDDLWSRYSSASGEEMSGESVDWRTQQEKRWIKRLLRQERSRQSRHARRGSLKSPDRGVLTGRLGATTTDLRPSTSVVREAVSNMHNSDGPASVRTSQKSCDLDSHLPSLSPDFFWTSVPAGLSARLNLSPKRRVTSLQSMLLSFARYQHQKMVLQAVIFAEIRRVPDIIDTVNDKLASMLTARRHPNRQLWLCTVSDMLDFTAGARIMQDLPPGSLRQLY